MILMKASTSKKPCYATTLSRCELERLGAAAPLGDLVFDGRTTAAATLNCCMPVAAWRSSACPCSEYASPSRRQLRSAPSAVPDHRGIECNGGAPHRAPFPDQRGIECNGRRSDSIICSKQYNMYCTSTVQYGTQPSLA